MPADPACEYHVHFFKNDPERFQDYANTLAEVAKYLAPIIDRVFPFDELPAAKAYMESDAQVGKIVIRVT